VLAPEELRAPDDAFLDLTDAETGERLELALTPARRLFVQERAEAFVRERRALFRRHGARSVRLQPGDDLVAAVERIVLGEEAA